MTATGSSVRSNGVEKVDAFCCSEGVHKGAHADEGAAHRQSNGDETTLVSIRQQHTGAARRRRVTAERESGAHGRVAQGAVGGGLRGASPRLTDQVTRLQSAVR